MLTVLIAAGRGSAISRAKPARSPALNPLLNFGDEQPERSLPLLQDSAHFGRPETENVDENGNRARQKREVEERNDANVAALSHAVMLPGTWWSVQSSGNEKAHPPGTGERACSACSASRFLA